MKCTSVWTRPERNFFRANKQQEVAKQMLEWRWLIIDEISMASAELLAGVDCKPRALSRGNSPFTKHKHGQQRLFACLNFLFSGDVWQLPLSINFQYIFV